MPTFPTNATFTPRLQLPRPGLDDPADGPDAFSDLTDVLDPIVAGYASGTTAARPPGYAGQFYWNTETGKLEFYNGTAWGSANGTGVIGAALPILDVGMVGQIRAGRQLTVTDFTALGLSQPVGLWNLSDLTNPGSDGRALANKGAVPFGVGINGLAATAAVFAGSASQALYIPDSGAADPFRIRTGSWGCWFRTAKRATSQATVSKWSAGAGNQSWWLGTTSNVVTVFLTYDGSGSFPFNGVSDVCDDRWHYAVATFDGTTVRVYVDGVLETVGGFSLPIFAGTAPLNVGANAADGGTAATSPHYGRVDEAFVTADVLSDNQVRLLYCAKIAHTLGAVPTRANLLVRRRRKGGVLAITDFPATPVRLHNFTAGSLNDEGSGGIAVTPSLGGGAIVSVAGADGTLNGAYSFSGTHGGMMATDAGLPAGTAARTYGAWFKTATASTTNGQGIVAWGTNNTGDALLRLGSTGLLACSSGADAIVGPFAADGQWHQAIAVEDNAAGDGVRRKLYLDGREVGGSTVLNAIVLVGALNMRIGIPAGAGTAAPFIGQLDGAFVFAGALTMEQVAALYAKGTQALVGSIKEPGAHVEAMDATSAYIVFDTLDSQHQIDLGVAA